MVTVASIPPPGIGLDPLETKIWCARSIFEIGYNRLSSPNKLAWRDIAKSSNRRALQVSGMFSV
jgi:hypothetical protein